MIYIRVAVIPLNPLRVAFPVRFAPVVLISIIALFQGYFCTDERALAGLLITYTKAEIEELNATYKLCK